MIDESNMLEIGSRLSERYRIESVIGRGGMGAVYLGSVESLGNKKVAIKEMVIPPATGHTQEQAIQQFKKEATFLAHLDHPNVVKVTDFFADGDKHYLVMDYVEGQTLQQVLEQNQRPFEWDELSGIADSLMEVLSYLHSQSPPILFRDLKPANIMLEADGRIKLIDFGIARTATPGMETSTFLKGTGTNGFSPIEQYGMGESTDQRSDIYALGATLYYLLSGKLPPEAIARVNGSKELVPLSKLNSKVPIGLSNVLAKCMAIKQKERYRNVALVREMLHQAVPQGGEDTEVFSVPEPAAQYPVKDNSSTWAAVLATMTVAAAVMMIIVVHYVSDLAAKQDVAAEPIEQPSVTAPEGREWRSIPEVSTSYPTLPNRSVVEVTAPESINFSKFQSQSQEPVKVTVSRTPSEPEKEPAKRVVKTSLGDGPNYPRAASTPAVDQTNPTISRPIRKGPEFRLPPRPRSKRPFPGRRLGS